MQARE
jgi:hypothetical protein